MDRDYTMETGTEILHCSGLWFMLQRTTDHTQRAACYLCGWWSKGDLTHTATAIELSEHLATLEHQLAVREYVTLAEGRTGTQSPGHVGHTCPHCLRTTFDPHDIQLHYCPFCHHYCSSEAPPPTPAASAPSLPLPEPPEAPRRPRPW